MGLVARLLGIETADQLTTHPLRGSLFGNWVVVELIKGRFNRGASCSPAGSAPARLTAAGGRDTFPDAMDRSSGKRSYSLGWLIALIAIASVSVVVYLITYFIDAEDPGLGNLVRLLFSPESQQALGNMPEVITAVLGVAITVVAIIVELAANRYTPRITELFVTAPINVATLGFFVVTGLLCVWVSLTAGAEGLVAHTGTVVCVVAATVCMIILLPYFAFVFAFLDPHHIIDHMAASALGAIRRGGRVRGVGARRAKQLAVRGIEQLADVALNAIENKDKVICMHAVDSLGRLMLRYAVDKSACHERWFLLDESVRENPDFISMHEEVLADIEKGRLWLEMKVLRQYQMLYGETLNRMRDINYLIAIDTRKVAEDAMSRDDELVAALALKFFNTYLRATINGRDVRTAYNVLNQYRLLAEAALRAGRDAVALEIARRFQYYGQLGFTSGLPFVLETAAYDLCNLNETAFAIGSPACDALLAVFLEVDKEAEEGHALEASLRGVRKAQIKLATCYLTSGAEHLARTIFDDMREEVPSRLSSIREELGSITSKDFWEISDRGVNFDYLDPRRRAALDTFFGWFSQLESAGAGR